MSLAGVLLATAVTASETPLYGDWALQNSIESDGLVAAVTSREQTTVTLMFDTNHACGAVLTLVVPSAPEAKGRRHDVPLLVAADAGSSYRLNGHTVDGDGVTAFVYGYIDKSSAAWLDHVLGGENLTLLLDEHSYQFSLEGSRAAVDTAFALCHAGTGAGAGS